MVDTQIIEPGRPFNAFWHCAGLGALILNKVRRTLHPYATPRPFGPKHIERAVEYDLSVFTHWMEYLREYGGNEEGIQGKTVLELGPGPDLGVGLFALARGARRYVAVDAHNLLGRTPPAFYDALLKRIGPQAAGEGSLREELEEALDGRGERLRYVCRDDFDVAAAGCDGVDLFLSQAAFEHLDDPDRTVGQLGSVAAPGAVFCALIDLATHTRWLRSGDPLNIYRFGDGVYNALRFRGSPNRVRPGEYCRSLRRHGWKDIRVMVLSRAGSRYFQTVLPHLASGFRDPAAEVDVLSAVLCARKD